MDGDGDGTGLGNENDIRNLSNGLLAIYEDPLSKVSNSLRELTTKQEALINSVYVQNQRLLSIQNNDEMNTMFTDINYCREQLMMIKKQMTSLHEKSGRLRVRAQNIMACANNRQKIRSAELANEQKLIGSHN